MKRLLLLLLVIIPSFLAVSATARAATGSVSITGIRYGQVSLAVAVSTTKKAQVRTYCTQPLANPITYDVTKSVPTTTANVTFTGVPTTTTWGGISPVTHQEIFYRPQCRSIVSVGGIQVAGLAFVADDLAISVTPSDPTGGFPHASATLVGPLTVYAVGVVTYSVYSDSGCTLNRQDGGSVAPWDGLVPDSNDLILGTGVVWWQASFSSADTNNNDAVSDCVPLAIP